MAPHVFHGWWDCNQHVLSNKVHNEFIMANCVCLWGLGLKSASPTQFLFFHNDGTVNHTSCPQKFHINIMALVFVCGGRISLSTSHPIHVCPQKWDRNLHVPVESPWQISWNSLFIYRGGILIGTSYLACSSIEAGLQIARLSQKSTMNMMATCVRPRRRDCKFHVLAKSPWWVSWHSVFFHGSMIAISIFCPKISLWI